VSSADGRQPAPSLDSRTKLARGRWRVKVFPDAAEAVISRQSAEGRGGSFVWDPRSDSPFDSAGARAARQVRRSGAVTFQVEIRVEAASHPRLVLAPPEALRIA